MMLLKNNAPNENDINEFLSLIKFRLPEGFIEFYKETNGADIGTEENYYILWPINEMIMLNKEYKVEVFAPRFFIFGSNGGGTAFAIDKETSHIFELPFIGMSNEDAEFRCTHFSDFIK